MWESLKMHFWDSTHVFSLKKRSFVLLRKFCRMQFYIFFRSTYTKSLSSQKAIMLCKWKWSSRIFAKLLLFFLFSRVIALENSSPTHAEFIFLPHYVYAILLIKVSQWLLYFWIYIHHRSGKLVLTPFWSSIFLK